jgi:hypothetical protein
MKYTNEWLQEFSENGESFLAKIHRNMKERTIKRGYHDIITFDQLEALFATTNGRCHLTGIKFTTDNPMKSRVRPFSPTVDRINSALGYIDGNCRVVCNAVNIAINDFGEEIFSKVAEGYILGKFANTYLFDKHLSNIVSVKDKANIKSTKCRMYKRSESGSWHFSIQINGKQYRKSTNKTDIDEAKAEAMRLIEQIKIEILGR